MVGTLFSLFSRPGKVGWLLIGVLIPAPLLAETTQTLTGGAQPRTNFYSSTRLRAEHDDRGSDVDLREYISLSVDDLWKDHLDFYLSTVLEFDLDHNDEVDTAFSDADHRLYETYLDFHDFGALSRLRIGRQQLRHVDYLLFDGAYLNFFDKKMLSAFLFGGRPVSYYESNASEWLAGGGLVFRPWRSTELQLDAYGIEDRGFDVFANAVRLNQYFSSGFGDRFEARWIDGDIRDLLLELRYFSQAWQFDVWGEVYWQPERQGDDSETRNARYFSPYALIMGPAEEEYSFSLNANKYLGKHFVLSGGGQYREIVDNGRETRENFTNRDSFYYFAGVSLIDFLTTGLNIDLYYNFYDNSSEDYYDVTGEISYECAPGVVSSLGVTHSRYNLDHRLAFEDVLGNEPENDLGGDQDSLIWFAEVRYKINKTWRVVLFGEYEDADGNEDTAWSAGMRVDFRWRHPEKKLREKLTRTAYNKQDYQHLGL